MKNVLLVRINSCIITIHLLTACSGQNSGSSGKSSDNNAIIGGGCDGCEIMYVGMPRNIDAVDTSMGWFEKGDKLLVTGTIFKLDGKTPAKDVIIYYWQTDNNGYYSPQKDMNPQAKRHGHIRGWIKSDSNGRYQIYTIRPAAYPDRGIPAHIHLAVKEPALSNEYYTDEINFDDDPLLLPYKKQHTLDLRGGTGIVRILMRNSLQVAEHNIILGLNIPNYPAKIMSAIESGLYIGEDQPSFTPNHAFGPDKGTKACPVCKYGRYHGILYFVGNHPDWQDINKWLLFLQRESVARKNFLKVYFIYGNEKNFDSASRENELQTLGAQLKLSNLALTYVQSFADSHNDINLNKINPAVANTFIIYKHSNIVDKYINLKATTGNFELLSNSLDKSTNDLFTLKEIAQHS